MGITIGITLGGAILGFMLAILLAFLRFEKVLILHWISAGYIDFIRNTPLIVQMFFVTFGLPPLIGYTWPFWAHAILALSLNFSAYFAEILRAGLDEISKEQHEAAQALGLPRIIKFFRVIFPQAIGYMYASLNAQFIFLFLTTGIISEIGVKDLTYAGLFIDSRTFRTFEVFFTLTILYILLSLGFKAILTLIEHRFFRWKFVK